MESKHDVEASADELARAVPEMAPVLARLRVATSALSSLFTALAGAPEGYAAVRSEIEQLDAERRRLLEQLGALAARVLVLRELPDEDAEAVEVIALAPTPTSPGPLPPASSVASESAPDSSPTASPPPPPVSQRQLDAFFSTQVTNGVARSSTTDGKTMLLSLANFVAIAAEAPVDLDDEIGSLERATAEARVPLWKKMSEPAQVRWVELLVAWAKALEAEARTKGIGEERVRAAFRRLRKFSRYDSPGFIYGFARDADPRGKSWRANAADVLAGLRGRPRENDTPKPTTVVYDELYVDDERESKVPEDWPYWAYVKGKDLVMLGGEVREERRVALEEAFQMASLTWVPHNRPRQLQAMAERAANGTIDIVLVNKFIAHKETLALEKKVSAVPVITMRHGYGITAVKTAIEEWFSRRDANVG